MKKKMRIKVLTNCEKCKRKAMEVAVGAKGVISVALEGEFEDELVVVGDGVDAACLVDALRKKVCYAILETLEEVTPPEDDDVKPQDDNDTDKSSNIETVDDDDDNSSNQVAPPHCCSGQCSSIYYNQPHREMYEVVYDSYGPSSGCKIM